LKQKKGGIVMSFETNPEILNVYLRTFIQGKVILFLDKSKCEICDRKEKLEVHHSNDLQFSDIVYKSLDLLNLPYKEFWKDYSERDIEKIKLMVLGYHFYSKFNIYCKECHTKNHKNNLKNKVENRYKALLSKYQWQLEHYRNTYPEASLDDIYNNFNKFYLEEVINTFKNIILVGDNLDTFKRLITKFLIFDHVRKLSNLNKTPYEPSKNIEIRNMNKILKLYNTNVLISSKQLHKKPYRYKNCWIIEDIIEGNNNDRF